MLGTLLTSIPETTSIGGGRVKTLPYEMASLGTLAGGQESARHPPDLDPSKDTPQQGPAFACTPWVREPVNAGQ